MHWKTSRQGLHQIEERCGGEAKALVQLRTNAILIMNQFNSFRIYLGGKEKFIFIQKRRVLPNGYITYLRSIKIIVYLIQFNTKFTKHEASCKSSY